jgi:hypothetical protein
MAVWLVSTAGVGVVRMDTHCLHYRGFENGLAYFPNPHSYRMLCTIWFYLALVFERGIRTTIRQNVGTRPGLPSSFCDLFYHVARAESPGEALT